MKWTEVNRRAWASSQIPRAPNSQTGSSRVRRSGTHEVFPLGVRSLIAWPWKLWPTWLRYLENSGSCIKKRGKTGNHQRGVAPMAKERLSDYRRTFINIHGSLPWTIWLMYQLLTRYLHTSVFRLMHHIFNHTAQPTNLYSILSKGVRPLIEARVHPRRTRHCACMTIPRGKMPRLQAAFDTSNSLNWLKESCFNSR